VKLHVKIENIELFLKSVLRETDEDFKHSLKLKDGDYLAVETWKPRSIVNHRRFFALLLRTIYLLPEEEVYDKCRNIDYFREELLITIGYVDIHIRMNGEMCIKAKSMNFQTMDDVEFNRIYHLCTEKIVNVYLKNISLEDFELYILKFI
jgi:hypothetical protein